jgi:hypothetical protein
MRSLGETGMLNVMAQVAVRVSDDLLEEVDAVAARLRSTRSDFVRRAIKQYLYSLACERDAGLYEQFPLTDDELALAACSTGDAKRGAIR